MALLTRARIAGILAISLLMLGSPGAAMAGAPSLLIDAMIRPGWNPTYTGDGVKNTTAAGQSVFNSGVVDQKLTFFIRIQNELPEYNTFRVKRAGFFHEGYRVRYYDANGTDVTGKVNVGWVTPQLPPGGTYDMRATVKIRSFATPCSFVSRLVNVSYLNAAQWDPDFSDTVGFSAGLAPPCG